MISYNTDFLIKVEVKGFIASQWYVYRTEKKLFGFTTREEGYYCNILSYYSKEVPKQHTMIKGVVHENPKCVLHYADYIIKGYVFETENKAAEFGSKFTDSDKWLNP